MARLFEYLLIAGLLYWLYRRWTRSQQEPKESSVNFQTNAPRVDVMVSCATCGVHLPQNDAIEFDKRYFCEANHLDRFNVEGWLGSAKHMPSPNYDQRPEGVSIDTVVIHHISLPPGEFGSKSIEDFFCNRLDPKEHPYFSEIAHLQVSSHFLITRSGELIQFVPISKRAWHAGASQLFDRERCNDFSIGIELEGTGDIPFEEAQYKTLSKLTILINEANSIRFFVGHSDIAPGRKTDPGQSFDWKQFASQTGISDEKLPFGTLSR